jgi:sugar phosphate isomerase/epimerase
MYRNLSTAALGVSGRQSELIELALTYGFRSLDLDFSEIVKRARARSVESATRLVQSANIRVATFDVPVQWRGDDTSFQSALVELKEHAEIAQSLGATGCIATILPAGDNMPYHESFEFHRSRFAEMGNVLQPFGIRLGLAFLAAPEHRAGQDYPFIHQAEAMLTLIKTIGNANIGLALDTWNWHVGAGALDQLAELKAEQIVDVRLANIALETDISKITDEQRELPNQEGQVDCAAILRQVAQLGYDGPVSVMPHPSRFTGMTRDAIVQQACAAFDETFKAAGLSRSGKIEPIAAETE